MTIVNLTPHALAIYDLDGTTLLQTVESSGMTRLSETVTDTGDTLEGIPVVEIVRDASCITGVPDPVADTIYVVSDMAFGPLRASGRTDIFRPGVAVRNETGQIIGCKGLSI